MIAGDENAYKGEVRWTSIAGPAYSASGLSETSEGFVNTCLARWFLAYTRSYGCSVHSATIRSMDVDYKTAKEAFVADNPGESIWTIQITSFTALFAYALYAVLSKRTRGPLVDYLTTVLPLLLSVTVFSTTRRAIALHVCLAVLIVAVHIAKPTGGSEINRPNSKKSQGKWLDESDSDEEPSQPVYTSSTSYPLSRLSTSSSADASGGSRPISPVEPPGASSTLSPDRAEKPEISRRTFKRRHSPTPSTHTHTAIDVLQTPETNTFTTDTNPAYPRHPRARGPGQDGRVQGREKGRLPFLSVYRAHMMIMTVHCILAVDFPIFPRVQGKCEDFGTSLVGGWKVLLRWYLTADGRGRWLVRLLSRPRIRPSGLGSVERKHAVRCIQGIEEGFSHTGLRPDSRAHGEGHRVSGESVQGPRWASMLMYRNILQSMACTGTSSSLSAACPYWASRYRLFANTSAGRLSRCS